VGACVGVRGSRIKSIIDELNGEKIDIIRWSDNPEVLISNALKPSKVDRIILDEAMNKATVIVAEDQLSLAIGKKGQNVRLASRLAEWEIDILTEEEAIERNERAVAEFMCVPGMAEEDAHALNDFGYYSLADIYLRGADFLTSVEGFDRDRAESVLRFLDQLDFDAFQAEMDRTFQVEEEEEAPAEDGGETAPEDEAGEAGEAGEEGAAAPEAEAPEPPGEDEARDGDDVTEPQAE
jgi:N utilization substance protein A